jgi:hypothetical protein
VAARATRMGHFTGRHRKDNMLRCAPKASQLRWKMRCPTGRLATALNQHAHRVGH